MVMYPPPNRPDLPPERGYDPNRPYGPLPPALGEYAPKDKLQEGTKYDGDKPRMDLLDPAALAELSHVLTFGAKKYEAHNWRKGIKVSRLVAALLRHVFAFLKGETYDPESKLHHIAHAMCCCMFILGQNKPEMDDRYEAN